VETKDLTPIWWCFDDDPISDVSKNLAKVAYTIRAGHIIYQK